MTHQTCQYRFINKLNTNTLNTELKQ